jgi:hypothetical protein
MVRRACGSQWIEIARGFVGLAEPETRCVMDLSSPLQSIMVIVGPILLALAIAWAMLRNRATRGDVKRTEEATRARYDQQDKDDKARENGGVA